MVWNGYKKKKRKEERRMNEFDFYTQNLLYFIQVQADMLSIITYQLHIR